MEMKSKLHLASPTCHDSSQSTCGLLSKCDFLSQCVVTLGDLLGVDLFIPHTK